jgi:vacuolar protein sorting-associated protein 45
MATPFDGVSAVRSYLDRLIQGDGKCSGRMKVLLLDSMTTQIVSAVYSQTHVLQQQVYLVERIDAETPTSSSSSSTTSTTGSGSHLAAVVFIRPSSLPHLLRELSQPRYAEYHVFFSSVLPKLLLRKLAEHDVHERVQQLQEFYVDFCPLDVDLLTLNCRHALAMTVAAGTSWAPKYASLYDLHLQGLQTMLLALKRQPMAIRYAKHSPCAEELAKDLQEAIQADDIFQIRRNSNTMLLLILDRRDDPVTPLLSQWTYQAMVHELLGLNNHRVVLKNAPNIPPDLEQVVLSSSQDAFFANNRHKNFGELGEEIQRLLNEYQQQTASANQNLQTLQDMQAFMDRFPELKSQSHVVSKHVAIMGELARLVQICSLMDVSQLEQELACADDYNAHWRELLDKLNSTQIKIPDKLRLGLLFALRYEHAGNMHMLQSAMIKGGVSQDMVRLLPVLLRYAGSQARGPGLYGEHQFVMLNKMKSLMTSVQGVENVYTQHVPLLMDTLQAICKGKLPSKTHPIVPGSAHHVPSGGADPASIVPQEILIFMVGGVTYEEATKVAEFNAKGRIKVILAGSTVHNSTSFLEELKATER